ncbi:hypothetical protein D3C76_1431000 [compost metagenome]
MIANIFDRTQGILGFPEDESTDGVALQDAVDQLCALLLVPDKFSLKHRELDLAGVDFEEQRFVLLVRVLRA